MMLVQGQHSFIIYLPGKRAYDAGAGSTQLYNISARKKSM